MSILMANSEEEKFTFSLTLSVGCTTPRSKGIVIDASCRGNLSLYIPIPLPTRNLDVLEHCPSEKSEESIPAK